MFKKLLLIFFLLFSSFITIYPSTKENTKLFDYCYNLEKIFSRNSVVKSKNISRKVKTYAKDITLIGTSKTKGALVNKIIDQYKNSKKSLIISFVPNRVYCLTGYWIEYVNPGTFTLLFYEKTKRSINKYKDAKQEVDEFIRDINSEYKSIRKEIKDLF